MGTSSCCAVSRLVTRDTQRRGDRRKSLPTWGVVGRDFRRVHSWVIRQSAAEPDGPGVDAPVTPTFIRRSNAEPDERQVSGAGKSRSEGRAEAVYRRLQTLVRPGPAAGLPAERYACAVTRCASQGTAIPSSSTRPATPCRCARPGPFAASRSRPPQPGHRRPREIAQRKFRQGRIPREPTPDPQPDRVNPAPATRARSSSASARLNAARRLVAPPGPTERSRASASAA